MNLQHVTINNKQLNIINVRGLFIYKPADCVTCSMQINKLWQTIFKKGKLHLESIRILLEQESSRFHLSSNTFLLIFPYYHLFLFNLGIRCIPGTQDRWWTIRHLWLVRKLCHNSFLLDVSYFISQYCRLLYLNVYVF